MNWLEICSRFIYQLNLHGISILELLKFPVWNLYLLSNLRAKSHRSRTPCTSFLFYPRISFPFKVPSNPVEEGMQPNAGGIRSLLSSPSGLYIKLRFYGSVIVKIKARKPSYKARYLFVLSFYPVSCLNRFSIALFGQMFKGFVERYSSTFQDTRIMKFFNIFADWISCIFTFQEFYDTLKIDIFMNGYNQQFKFSYCTRDR